MSIRDKSYFNTNIKLRNRQSIRQNQTYLFVFVFNLFFLADGLEVELFPDTACRVKTPLLIGDLRGTSVGPYPWFIAWERLVTRLAILDWRRTRD